MEILRKMGVEVRELSTNEKLRGFRGVVVTKLLSDGNAAGILKPGDLIVALNNSQITGSNEFYLHLAASAAVQATSLHILREDAPQRLVLPVVENE